jgi:hypothetical protein
MPEFPPQRRVRKPFKSARVIKERRADGQLLLAHAETVEDNKVKSLIIQAARDLGAKPPKKALPAAPAETETQRMGGPPGGAADNPEQKPKPAPAKPEFTTAIQALVDSRPDLAEKLLPVARLSQPAPVRAGQLRAIIADNPPQPPAPPKIETPIPPPAERSNPRMPDIAEVK